MFSFSSNARRPPEQQSTSSPSRSRSHSTHGPTPASSSSSVSAPPSAYPPSPSAATKFKKAHAGSWKLPSLDFTKGPQEGLGLRASSGDEDIGGFPLWFQGPASTPPQTDSPVPSSSTSSGSGLLLVGSPVKRGSSAEVPRRRTTGKPEPAATPTAPPRPRSTSPSLTVKKKRSTTNPSAKPDFGSLFGGGSGSKSPGKLFGSRPLATPPIVVNQVDSPFSSSLFPPPSSHPQPSRQSSSSSIALSAPGSALPRPILRRGSSAGSFRPSSQASSSNGSGVFGGSSGWQRRGSEDVRKWEADVPERDEEEGVEEWVSRLKEVVPRSEVATVLASNGDEFHASALRNYMLTFDLANLPLDVALRKLLMEVSLPRETQQIDRVMEAFAKQYLTSNPGLFVSEDHPYIIAFSLIMLHTDAFNKSNKNKMTKADYVKNTRLDGVNPLVLDTFFDNITYTPFVFIEDDNDINGSQSLSATDFSPSNTLTNPFGFSTTPTSSFLSLSKTPSSSNNKIDVYDLISSNRVHTLRCPEVQLQIPKRTPFDYHGPKGFFDTGALHSAFAEADMIEVEQQGEVRRGSASEVGRRESKAQSLKLTKYGILSRKEETGDGGRKSSNRKWKDWSVILTGSQLLFFKDTTWALVLQNQADEQVGRKTPGGGGRLLLPKMASFQPDEILSVKDCIAITDTTYEKYAHAFHFIMPHGRQYILQASDNDELGEWMSHINYAAAFKTASVRMRGMGMTAGQAQLVGAAAAASHAKTLKSDSKTSLETANSVRTVDSAFHSTTQVRPPNRPRASTSTLDGFRSFSMRSNGSNASQLAPPSPKPGFASRLRSSSKPPEIALESPIGPSVDSSEQLESAFLEVKAQLAASRGVMARSSTSSGGSGRESLPSARTRAVSVGGTPPASERSSFEKVSGGVLGAELSESGLGGRSNHATRSEAIQIKVEQVKSRIQATQSQLDGELRTTRNLAILAPFRRSTRDRISFPVPSLARKIRTLRLELARFRCYEEILEKDLRVEEDEWQLVRHMCFGAATQRESQPYDRKSSLPTEI